MGSDGDRCPDRSLKNDEERQGMLAVTANGLNNSSETGNEDTTRAPETANIQSSSRAPSNLRYLPIVTFVFIMVSILTSYIIAGSLGHTHWNFPYISHTAIDTPERYIFAQMVNMGAAMLAANVYVKFLQMGVFLKQNNAPSRHYRINRIAEAFGFASAFGLTVVANFQTRDMQIVHYLGAFSAFIFGTVYCCLHTILSAKNTRPKMVTYVQITISTLLTISLTIFIISKIVYKIKEQKGYGTKYDTLRDVYLVSTSSEWLIAIFMISFVLTFYKDFSNIYWKSPSVTIINTDPTDQVHPHRPHQNGTSAV
jgi:hypothetical protein